MAELIRDTDAMPEGWRTAPFSALADYVNGRAFKPEDWGTEGLPIIRIAQITNPDAETNFFDGAVDPRNLIDDDDLIFSWSATLAVMRWRKGPAVLNQHLFKVTPAEGIDRDWLQFRLDASIPDLADEAHGTTMKHIRKGTLSSQSTIVPPLDEQRRIAEVLRSVDEAIAAADGVISQLQETRGLRLEALMALPGTYRRIDEVCRLSGGNGFPIKHQGKAAGQYPFAKVSDMNRPGNEVQMRNAENYVDEADLRTLKAKTFPVGTTFFPKVGATLLTNKRRIAAVEMLVDNNVMGAVATDIDPWFLYYAFCTIDMADYVQPGAVPSVNQRTIGQIMIPVPDRAAQEEFVETMRDLDAAIEMQSDALAQLTATKQSLMADLLSGRVRVPA
ncbi:restriction endonuclease subunit S [Aurantiacibacter spongiae]|nr:restriction endonuclease subunit S [Aurantiacibacter spongiae]